MRVILPWPPKELKPNARKQHRYIKDVRNGYKDECYYLAKGVKKPQQGNIALNITFHPPTGHRRDLDNCLAQIKYGLDGVAAGWGVDDALFRPIKIDFGAAVKGGAVIVEYGDVT